MFIRNVANVVGIDVIGHPDSLEFILLDRNYTRRRPARGRFQFMFAMMLILLFFLGHYFWYVKYGYDFAAVPAKFHCPLPFLISRNGSIEGSSAFCFLSTRNNDWLSMPHHLAPPLFTKEFYSFLLVHNHC